jgi:hypothetical protein
LLAWARFLNAGAIQTQAREGVVLAITPLGCQKVLFKALELFFRHHRTVLSRRVVHMALFILGSADEETCMFLIYATVADLYHLCCL